MAMTTVVTGLLSEGRAVLPYQGPCEHCPLRQPPLPYARTLQTK